MAKQAKKQMAGGGVALPVGTVGESLSFTSRSTTGTIGTWAVNTSALVTLTPGVWSLRGRVSFSGQGAANCVIALISTNTTADNSGGLSTVQQVYSANANATNNFNLALAELGLVTVSTNTAIYAKSFSEDAAVNVTFDGFAIRLA